jgi:molybdopterin molybdotransferase
VTGAGTRVLLPSATWEEARAAALESVRHPLPAVTRDLADALGHALAEPLVALTDLPAFGTSAMDGWAVAGAGPWRLQGRPVLAGGRAGPLTAGTAVPIATGAEVPPGASRVLRREDGEIEPGDLLGDRGPDRGAADNIRQQGEECRAGEVLLPAGTAVTPAVLGLAAAAGHDVLVVRRRPVVDLLVLGDELLESGPPGDGRVRDALGPLLPPWLRASGAEVTGRRRIADDLDLLRDAVAASPADVVVTTGSTASGPMDFLHTVLDDLGARLVVDTVEVRPGHPMLLAELPPTADGRVRRLVGLPGNPLAAIAGTVTLAVPLLRRLGGHHDAPPRQVPAARAFPGHPRHTRLLPVLLDGRGATPLPFGGPAMLRGLAVADGLAVVPPDGVAAGSAVQVLDVPAP